MTELPDDLRAATGNMLLSIADDKLMLGHRNTDWTGLAPLLEEDIAFSSISQDEIGHAQALYELASGLLGENADDLAFGRAPAAYRCAVITTMPDEFDWAAALSRKFFCDHFDLDRLRRLAISSWEPLAALATRLAAEEIIHVEHVDDWIIRLGRGGDESRERMQQALDALVGEACMLFEAIDDEDALADAGVFPVVGGDPFDVWCTAVTAVAADAGLQLAPRRPDGQRRGGRRGEQAPHFGGLLDEMCEVYRIAPQAAW